MDQEFKRISEFKIKEEYPINKEGVLNFSVLLFLVFILIFMNHYIDVIFFNLLDCFVAGLSLLMCIVIYQATFSLDERYLKQKDKKRFLSFCQDFPYELKRDFLSHLDFDRVSLKDVKELNKNIKSYNKYLESSK